MTENYLLEVKNVSKSFGVVKALNRIDFNVRPNEIHALCGENGAGKSTLMNILSGVYPYGSYGGEVYYDGELCKFRNVRESEKKISQSFISIWLFSLRFPLQRISFSEMKMQRTASSTGS